jgi:hypothetical protein
MRLSEITPEVLRGLRQIHAESGFDYAFPKDLETPLFPIRRAVVNDANWPVAAAALKVEAEAYLFVDPHSGTPESRWEAIQMLNSDLALRAREIGFDQVHCALPPEIAERFGCRLEELGWKLARPWPLYVFSLR